MLHFEQGVTNFGIKSKKKSALFTNEILPLKLNKKRGIYQKNTGKITVYILCKIVYNIRA